MERVFSLKSKTDINDLNEMLESLGIRVDPMALTVHMDTETFRRAKTRKAGRPYAILKENGYLAHLTKGEVKERMTEESAAEIAASLGISRRTLFRRLKEARNDEDELL